MTTTPEPESWHRIVFDLEVDEDGWPPVSSERVWALRTGDNTYQIRNFPFFITGIAWGDEVAVREDDGVLFYDHRVRASGNSTIFVIVNDESEVEAVMKALEEMGCGSELSHISSLFSLNVPPEVDLDDVLAYLMEGFDRERWDFQVACLGQETDDEPTEDDGAG